jgi:addiction module RelE/StbE family toxin
MRLRLTARATQDLTEIADYIRARNPNAALRVRTAILQALESVVLFPQLGRRQTIEGVRKLVTRRYPYLIYYAIDESAEQVVVLTIQHASRKRSQRDA